MSPQCNSCKYVWNQDLFSERTEVSEAVRKIRGIRCPNCNAGFKQITLNFSGHDPKAPKRDASFTCPKCGLMSWHPQDVSHKYCGRCHEFHDNPY